MKEPKPFRLSPISVSYTGWSRYQKCRQQHYLIMTGQRPETRDERDFFRGIVLHAVLEDWLNSSEPLEWIAEAVRPTWERLKVGRTLLWKNDADEATMLATAVEWAQNLERQLGEMNLDRSVCKAEHNVERYVWVDLGNGTEVEVKLNGKIDLLVPGVAGPPIVFDLKASASSSIIDPYQAVFYSLLMDDVLPGPHFLKHAGFILPASGKVVPYEITAEARDWLMEDIRQMARDCVAGKFEPDPDNSKCFRCDVKGVCPAQGGGMPTGRGRVQI